MWQSLVTIGQAISEINRRKKELEIWGIAQREAALGMRKQALINF